MERPTVHPQAGDPAGTSTAPMRGVGIDLAAELVQNPQERLKRRSGGGPMSSGSSPIARRSTTRESRRFHVSARAFRNRSRSGAQLPCGLRTRVGLGDREADRGNPYDRWLELRPLHGSAERSTGRRPFCICRRGPAPRSRVAVAGTVEPPEPDRAAHQADHPRTERPHRQQHRAQRHQREHTHELKLARRCTRLSTPWMVRHASGIVGVVEHLQAVALPDDPSASGTRLRCHPLLARRSNHHAPRLELTSIRALM